MMDIVKLEEFRKKKLLKVILINILATIFIIASLAGLINSQIYSLVVVLFFLVSIILLVFAGNECKNFENTVKESCIDSIIANILNGRGSIEWDKQSEPFGKNYVDLKRSDAFLAEPNKNPLIISKLFKKGSIRVDDVFTGDYKGIPVVITEATLQWGSGKRRTIIFSGLSICIDLKKSFAGHTVIGKKRYMDINGLQKLNLRSQFSKKYDIFTDNVEEASQLMTPEFVNFLTLSKDPIFVACYDNTIVAAVDQEGDLFKLGNIYKRVDDQKQYIKFAEQFNFALNVIDNLIAITSNISQKSNV